MVATLGSSIGISRYSLADGSRTEIVFSSAPRVPLLPQSVGCRYRSPGRLSDRLGLNCLKMNAHTFSTHVAQTLTTTVPNKPDLDWLLLPGLLMAECGIILVSLSGWVALLSSMQILLLVCGSIVGLLGIVLIPFWIIRGMIINSRVRLTEVNKPARHSEWVRDPKVK